MLQLIKNKDSSYLFALCHLDCFITSNYCQFQYLAFIGIDKLNEKVKLLKFAKRAVTICQKIAQFHYFCFIVASNEESWIICALVSHPLAQIKHI